MGKRSAILGQPGSAVPTMTVSPAGETGAVTPGGDPLGITSRRRIDVSPPEAAPTSVISPGLRGDECMRVRNWACWALVVAGVTVAPVRAQDAKPAAPTIAVRVKSIDGLLADVQYLAGLVGQEEQAKQLQGILEGMAGPKGLTGTGIDTKRPIGLYAVVTPGGVDSYASLLVPVADEKAFVELATDLLRRV